MVKNLRLIAFATLILSGCSPGTPHSLFGDWKGEMLSVTNETGNETVTVPVSKYGYLNLALRRDSSYVFSLGVFKDVKVEKKIMGIEGSIVLLPAVYKSTRFGNFTRRDSTFELASKEGAIFAIPHSDLSRLTLRFRDVSNRQWSCMLVPKE